MNCVTLFWNSLLESGESHESEQSAAVFAVRIIFLHVSAFFYCNLLLKIMIRIFQNNMDSKWMSSLLINFMKILSTAFNL